MTIRFTCPSCGAALPVDDCPGGKTVRCPGCSTLVPVPACDYYEVLQVSPKAEVEIIHAAYRRLAFKWHPDKRPGDSSASDQMKLLTEAYAVLSNPKKRQEYDHQRRESGTGSVAQDGPHDPGRRTNRNPRQGCNPPRLRSRRRQKNRKRRPPRKTPGSRSWLGA